FSPPNDLSPESISPETLKFLSHFLRGRAADLIRDRILTGDALPEQANQHLPAARALELDSSIKSIRGETIATPDRTVEALAMAWIQEQRAKVRAGQMAPDRADNLRLQLEHFRDFVGRTAAVECIDATIVTGFYRCCLAKIEARKQDSARRVGWGPDH